MHKRRKIHLFYVDKLQDLNKSKAPLTYRTSPMNVHKIGIKNHRRKSLFDWHYSPQKSHSILNSLLERLLNIFSFRKSHGCISTQDCQLNSELRIAAPPHIFHRASGWTKRQRGAERIKGDFSRTVKLWQEPKHILIFPTTSPLAFWAEAHNWSIFIYCCIHVWWRSSLRKDCYYIRISLKIVKVLKELWAHGDWEITPAEKAAPSRLALRGNNWHFSPILWNDVFSRWLQIILAH